MTVTISEELLINGVHVSRETMISCPNYPYNENVNAIVRVLSEDFNEINDKQVLD